MNTKPITSSFIVRAALLLLTVLTTTVAWAQSPTTVSTEKQLTDAIADGATNIQLTADIRLSKYLDINGKTLTIDLKGNKLSRNLSEHNSQGHVIWAHNNSNLTLTSSVVGGSIEGGKANNGGAINIPNGNTVSVTNVTFRNNSAPTMLVPSGTTAYLRRPTAPLRITPPKTWAPSITPKQIAAAVLPL